jgi:hypothetical protein
LVTIGLFEATKTIGQTLANNDRITWLIWIYEEKLVHMPNMKCQI